jgi:hypothetical protein
MTKPFLRFRSSLPGDRLGAARYLGGAAIAMLALAMTSGLVVGGI